MSTAATTSNAPFHGLLSYYAHQSPYPDTQTIRVIDSLRGNLRLGLDFPFALAIALGRHLWLHNTGNPLFLQIHVPSVPVTKTPLHTLSLRRHDDADDGDGDGNSVRDEKRTFTCAEMVERGGRANGWAGRLDALGLWSVAADVRTGLLSGEDVKAFQKGTLFEGLAERRRWRGDDAQVLPLWRGGPAWTVGHSWAVKRLFDVDVYQRDRKED